MKIYIDNDYKCHVSDDGTMREFEIPAFDGKCREYIEGYRYIPQYETWTRDDGKIFTGIMLTAHKPSPALELAQLKYEISEIDRILTGEVSINDEI